MTVTDAPPQRPDVDEAQLLFSEAKQRRKRRWQLGGVVVAAVVIAAALAVGLWGVHGGASPRPVARPSANPPPAATASAGVGFSARPVLCYAAPYSVAPGRAPATGSLPSCSASTALTASNLRVTPDSPGTDGYSTNTGIPVDGSFAPYRSTPQGGPGQTVLLPGTPANGPDRYLLGPAGLTRSGIAHAVATSVDGQWIVELNLTATGAHEWNALAASQFHQVVGIVVGRRVVSAPITEPTQAAFASFGQRLAISGSFAEHQARVLAAQL